MVVLGLPWCPGLPLAVGVCRLLCPWASFGWCVVLLFALPLLACLLACLETLVSIDAVVFATSCKNITFFIETLDALIEVSGSTAWNKTCLLTDIINLAMRVEYGAAARRSFLPGSCIYVCKANPFMLDLLLYMWSVYLFAYTE